MAFLDDNVKKEVKEGLSQLNDEVNLIYFSQSEGCEYCKDTQNLLEEVAELSDKINLKIMDFDKDKAEAEKYGVNKVPATVVLSNKDYGIKLYGIPTGYEFSSLLEDIRMVSDGKIDMPDDFRNELEKIDKPIHLQIFVTPTCPHCPKAVITSHMFAMVSDNIKAEMVEATEFPELSQKYGVKGVPQIVINEKPTQAGALPPQMLLEEIKKA